MKVIAQYQDFSDPDGFPNVYKLNDGSTVYTSEKVGIHLSQDGEVLETSYKAGFNSDLQNALDTTDVEIQDFNNEIASEYDEAMTQWGVS